MTRARLIGVFVAGLLFGVGLALSGLMDPARVIGFLNVAGAWDPSLAFVMGGAVGTYGLGMWAWRRRARTRGWSGREVPSSGAAGFDGRLIGGAVVFGIGWGLSGFCPGPAIASLGALRLEALVFVPAMVVGMLVARRFFGADRGESDRPLHGASPAGKDPAITRAGC